MLAHSRLPLLHRPAPCVVLAAVLLAILGMVLPGWVAAQPTASATIEGSWSLDFPNETATSRQLVAFLPGGVVIATNAPSFSEATAAGGRVHSTEGLGAWVSLGEGRYAFIVVFLYFDPDEEPWGTLTVEGVLTLDPAGDHLHGTFRVALTSAAGMPVFAAEEEPLVGARIRPRAEPHAQASVEAAFQAALGLHD